MTVVSMKVVQEMGDLLFYKKAFNATFDEIKKMKETEEDTTICKHLLDFMVKIEEGEIKV